MEKIQENTIAGTTQEPDEDRPLPRFASVVAMLEENVAEHAFPGAVFGVAHRGETLAVAGVGRFTFKLDSPPVLPGTSFDLASVSKVVATTAMAMLLWQRGMLALDTPLHEILPAFAGKDQQADAARRRLVTLRMLLTHSSGLPAYEPLYESFPEPVGLFRAMLNLPLAAEPGTVYAYSDPGFILLGAALEVLAGERMDTFCEREIFSVLGMSETRYRPAPEDAEQIPPTEVDRAYRMGVIQGVVHDENCFALGGVSGHAGLFAPAADVLKFAEAMLAPLRNPSGPEHLFEAETIRVFTRRAEQPAQSPRGLGWDTPSGTPSSSGSYLSAQAFGHLGFTGTSLWIDPGSDLAITLLTNRTYPTRANRAVQVVRPMVHDAIFRTLFPVP